MSASNILWYWMVHMLFINMLLKVVYHGITLCKSITVCKCLVCVLLQWGSAGDWQRSLHLQHFPEGRGQGELHPHPGGNERYWGENVHHLGQVCGEMIYLLYMVINIITHPGYMRHEDFMHLFLCILILLFYLYYYLYPEWVFIIQ